MVILKATYQSTLLYKLIEVLIYIYIYIYKACWGNIPFKFQDVSLVSPLDSRGHKAPSHDPVMVGSSGRYRVVGRFLLEYSGRYQVGR
jgi:hypothetical protein